MRALMRRASKAYHCMCGGGGEEEKVKKEQHYSHQFTYSCRLLYNVMQYCDVQLVEAKR